MIDHRSFHLTTMTYVVNNANGKGLQFSAKPCKIRKEVEVQSPTFLSRLHVCGNEQHSLMFSCFEKIFMDTRKSYFGIKSIQRFTKRILFIMQLLTMVTALFSTYFVICKYMIIRYFCSRITIPTNYLFMQNKRAFV